MLRLKQAIMKSGHVDGELQTQHFMTQLVDIRLLNAIGEHLSKPFSESSVTKVLTVETSGIPLAFAVSNALGVPFVYARREQLHHAHRNTYVAEVFSCSNNTTFTICIDTNCLNPEDRVLIVDDFLVHGSHVSALSRIVREAGSELVGFAFAVEKRNIENPNRLRDLGVRVECAVTIEQIIDNRIIFGV